MKNYIWRIMILLIIVGIALPAAAETKQELLTIPSGQSHLLQITKVQRVAVADPEIAEVVVVSANEVLINGGKPGVTTLHIWQDKGYHRFVLRVFQDNSYTAEQVKSAIANSGVVVVKVNDTIILKGTVETDYEKNDALVIAGSFGEKVVDLLTVKRPLQVKIKAYVVELNREKMRELGLEWGEMVRGVLAPQQMLLGQLNLNGGLKQLNPIGVELKALEEQKLSRTLAAPEIVSLSGQRSEILVGGEIPVIKSGDVVWKPYGIILVVNAEVLRSGEIKIVLEPEVSTVDWDNAIKVGDYMIPAFKTRRMNTTVTVVDGSTIVLGGLLSQSDIGKVDKLPFLGDLPIFGELFRSNQFRRGESELVLLVTTEIISEEEQQVLFNNKRPFVEEQERRLEEMSRTVQEGD